MLLNSLKMHGEEMAKKYKLTLAVIICQVSIQQQVLGIC